MVMKQIINHQFYLGDLKEAYTRLDIENEVGLSYEECDWKFLYEMAEPSDMRELVIEFKDSFQHDGIEVNGLRFENLNTESVRAYYTGKDHISTLKVPDKQIEVIQHYLIELGINVDLFQLA